MSENLLVGGTIRTMEKADVTPQQLQNYGTRVRKERQRQGMTQDDVVAVAVAAGHRLSKRRFIDVELGRYPVPSPKIQTAIEAGLGLDERTASPSLYGNTPLLRDGKPVPSETGEPPVSDEKQQGRRYTEEELQQLYTQEEVELFLKLKTALARHGSSEPGSEPGIYKWNDKFAFDRDGVEQLIAILDALPDREG